MSWIDGIFEGFMELLVVKVKALGFLDVLVHFVVEWKKQNDLKGSLPLPLCDPCGLKVFVSNLVSFMVMNLERSFKLCHLLDAPDFVKFFGLHSSEFTRYASMFDDTTHKQVGTDPTLSTLPPNWYTFWQSFSVAKLERLQFYSNFHLIHRKHPRWVTTFKSETCPIHVSLEEHFRRLAARNMALLVDNLWIYLNIFCSTYLFNDSFMECCRGRITSGMYTERVKVMIIKAV